MRALETELPIPREWPSHTVGGVVQAIALARFALMHVRGWCANSPIARVRLAGERDAALGELAAVREEARILRERIVAIRSAERPRYPPTLRAAILVLRAARGWTITETARRFVLTEATIASWMKRLDEGGPDALVALGTPVNRFPDYVGELVRRLRASFPALGKKRIADVLARSGLHLAIATVARMLKRKTPSPSGTSEGATTAQVDDAKSGEIAPADAKPRAVTAKAPHHVWHIDFTLLPLVSGFWTAWFPFSLMQRWPFAFWLGAVLDQYSRSVVAWKLWRSQPGADDVIALLDDARAQARSSPKHLVSDRGPQFREEYLAWCSEHGVKPRFGAVGQHGSIAVLERFWRSLRAKCFGGFRSCRWPCRRWPRRSSRTSTGTTSIVRTRDSADVLRARCSRVVCPHAKRLTSNLVRTSRYLGAIHGRFNVTVRGWTPVQAGDDRPSSRA